MAESNEKSDSDDSARSSQRSPLSRFLSANEDENFTYGKEPELPSTSKSEQIKTIMKLVDFWNQNPSKIIKPTNEIKKQLSEDQKKGPAIPPKPKINKNLPLTLDVVPTSSKPERVTRKKQAPAPPIAKDAIEEVTPNNDKRICHQDFLKIKNVQPKPSVKPAKFPDQMQNLIPWLVQKLKMWGGDILSPKSFIELISKDYAPPTDKKSPFSRVDAICLLLASCDEFVQHEIFRILSLFSVPLPLVVPNFDGQRFDFFGPMIQVNCMVKWAYKPGYVEDNYIFKDPHKMVLAIKVGEGAGKSICLNKLFSREYMFSTSKEPFAKMHGKTHHLNGFVEVLPLLENNCEEAFWSKISRNYMKKGAELFLLANFHGNILKDENLKLLEYLQPFASNFVVFYARDSHDLHEEYSNKLKSIIRSDFKEIWIDPLDEDHPLGIHSANLDEYHILEKLKGIIAETFQERTTCIDVPNPMENAEEIIDFIRPVGGLNIPIANEIIKYIQEKSCKGIKEKFILQTLILNEDYPDLESIKSNKEIMFMLETWSKLLNLPIAERKKAILQIELYFSQVSAKICQELRYQIANLNSQLREVNASEKIAEASNENSPNSEKSRAELQEKLEKATKNLDLSNLGLEHIFREFGWIYSLYRKPDEKKVKCDEISKISNFPEKCAELLLEGQAIELFDGDMSTINSTWINKLCHQICKKHPNFKVFILSILGIQSSGKSTLLNALFGCKFAVSVGRCTKGIFMRLIFLEKDLQEKLGAHAILLIDTEGLSAPVKMNDPDAKTKDRRMATFAMSISNLTIVNIKGEAFGEITEILQIVIVTMATLEKAKMSPDILLVQHVGEKNIGLNDDAIETFRKALQKAVDMTSEFERELCIRSEILQKLTQRLDEKKLLKQFGSFRSSSILNSPPSKEYHMDIVDLHHSILDILKDHEPMDLDIWHTMLPNYWDALEMEGFALNFENTREIQEYILRCRKITEIKEGIDSAIHYHRENIVERIKLQMIAIKEERTNIDEDTLMRLKNELIETHAQKVPKNCDLVECIKCNEAMEKFDTLLTRIGINNVRVYEDTQAIVNKYIGKAIENFKSDVDEIFNMDFFKLRNSQKIDTLINDIIKEYAGKIWPNNDGEIRDKLINEIWNKLNEEVLKIEGKSKPNTSVRVRILESFEEEIHNQLAPEYRRMILNENVEPPNLLDYDAYLAEIFIASITKVRIFKTRLNPTQVNSIHQKLGELVDQTILECKAAKFESKLIGHFLVLVDNFINNYGQSDGQMRKDFKWKIRMVSLSIFARKIEILEEKYQENLEPSLVLKKDEEFLKEVISSKIEGGLNIVKAANIITFQIMEVISEKVDKSCESMIMEAILKQRWIKNSENIRFEYFTDLVASSNVRGLRYVENPISDINIWYRNKINTIVGKMDLNSEAEKYIQEELEVITGELKNACGNWDDMFVLLFQYSIKNSLITYTLSTIYLFLEDEGNREKFTSTAFLDLVLTLLGDKTNEILRKISFKSPVNDPMFIRKLGCLETCMICGAICWGDYEHYENDSASFHFTAHQPLGLKGCYESGGKILKQRACYEIPDEQFCTKDGKPLKWDVVKKDGQEKWLFNHHPKPFFDLTMKTLFKELQEDIAIKHDLKPAPEKNEEEMGSISKKFWGFIGYYFGKKREIVLPDSKKVTEL